MRAKRLYSLLPIRDEEGERDLAKIKRLSYACGALLIVSCLIQLKEDKRRSLSV